MERFKALYDRVSAEHDAREERWERGEVTISELVERMTCPACEDGIDPDGNTCQFCCHGLTVYPAAVKALRFLAKREYDGMKRLIDDLHRREERKQKRKEDQSNV